MFFESNKLLRKILEETRETKFLLCEIIRLLTPNRILGGVMSEIGDSMLLPIAPGSSPEFGVTPTPAGVATVAAQAQWASSDTTNAPVTMNAADPTGLSATVNIPSTAVVGTGFTLTWTYTNADGTVADVTGTYTIIAAVPPATDVTGGTMAQIV